MPSGQKISHLNLLPVLLLPKQPLGAGCAGSTALHAHQWSLVPFANAAPSLSSWPYSGLSYFSTKPTLHWADSALSQLGSGQFYTGTTQHWTSSTLEQLSAGPILHQVNSAPRQLHSRPTLHWAANSPFPSLWEHRGEGKGSAAGMFTRTLGPHSVLKRDSWSPRCWVLGVAFPLAAQGLLGSGCTKPSSEQTTCSAAAEQKVSAL